MSIFKIKTSRQKGLQAEQQARCYLESHGLLFVDQNFHCKLGEIDLIMRDGIMLVFVEVRFRRRQSYGTGAETIGPAKQQKLVKTAQVFLQRYYTQWPPCRFDVVAVYPEGARNQYKCSWIPNAIQ